MKQNNYVHFYGINQVVSIIKAGQRKIFEIVGTKEGLAKLSTKGIKVASLNTKEVSIKHINNAMNLASVNHQGVVCLASYKSDIDTLEAIKKSKFAIILNNITDIGNIGAIIRTSIGFNVDLIIADKFGMPSIVNNADVCKASAGISEIARVSQVASLSKWIDVMKENNFKIIGLDAKGKYDIEKLSDEFKQVKQNKIAILVGSEGSGIDAKLLPQCNYISKINISSSVESLNASVAVGIAIFEMRKILTTK